MEQIEMIRKQKSEDNIEVEVKAQQGEGKEEAEGRLVVRIRDPIAPFILPALAEEIEADN